MSTNTGRRFIATTAQAKGMHVLTDGTIIGVNGNPLKTRLHKGYRCVNLKSNGRHYTLHICWLQALQKFGDAALQPGIETRHLNGNASDDSYDNIAIGTARDNAMDKPVEQRRAAAMKAAQAQRLFSEDDIRNIRLLREQGQTLNQLCSRYKTSRSHMSQITLRKIYKNV